MTTSTTPTKQLLTTNGIRMKALAWPPPATDATPALLLHGLTSCAETWSLVAPAIAEDRPVFALDLRGHGETDKPDGGYDPDTVVADIAGAMDALGLENACVAGHSWGCGLGVRLAAGHPGRVRKLALVDGGFGGRRPSSPSRASGAASGNDGVSPDWLEQMLAPIEIYRTVDTYLAEVRRSLNGHWSPEIEAIALASIYHNGDGSVRECLSREHQKLILAGGWGHDTAPLYEKLVCPVLLAPADNVTSTPERREARRAGIEEAVFRIPAATVRWVPETVHDIQLHKPDVLAPLLREHFGG